MATELPNEVLAYIFLFVRGPPASGALSASRLVCRGWRDVVDAHLKLDAPSEPYMEAYRLGYLSPPGLMPDHIGYHSGSLLFRLVRFAAEHHDAQLFRWVRDVLNTPVRDVLAPDDRYEVMGLLEDTALRVAAGVWEGLTVEQIEARASYLHPVDLARARAMGVKITDNGLYYIFNEFHDEQHFRDWSDDDIRVAAGRVPAKSLPALRWLLPRGFITPETIETWLDRCTMMRDRDLSLIVFILDWIADHGWTTALTTSTVYSFLDTDVSEVEAEWPLLQRAMTLIADAHLQRLWRPGAEGETFIRRLGRYLRLNFRARTSLDAITILNWMAQCGLYRDATLAEANEILIQVIDESPIEDRPEAARIVGWFLDHLPPPSERVLSYSLRWSAADHPVIRVLLEHRVPCNFTTVVSEFRGSADELRELLTIIFSVGYRLPSRMLPGEALHFTDWEMVMQLAVTHGQALNSVEWSEELLSQMARHDMGAVPLRILAEAGVAIPPAVREAAYQRALVTGRRTVADRFIACREDIEDDDADLTMATERMIENGIPPEPAVLTDLARLYVERVSTAPQLNLHVAGIRLARIEVTPADAPEMICLIRLAQAFPAHLPNEVTPILAEVGIASVACAHRAGYPIDAKKLLEVFESREPSRAAQMGAAWARRIERLDFEVVMEGVADVNVDVVELRRG